MKRFLGILFAMAALCAALLGCAASAEETDWTWEEQPDGTAVITGYSGETDTVTIPAEIGGKRVSGIADAAFASSTGFADVTVPGTVARIGNAAFAGIATLKTVTVEQGVEEIGSEAFTDCPNLTAVTLPESGVTGVGEKAFAFC